MPTHKTVFIIDDDEEIRTSVESIASTIGLACRGFTDVLQFLAAYDDESASCVVADVRLPGTSGIELLQLLPEQNYRCPVILISGYPDIDVAVEAMKKGAHDFLQKPFSARRFIEALQAAGRQREAQLIADSARKNAAYRLKGLTEREWDVAQLLIEGLNTKDIARRLELSHRTVEKYRQNIWIKTGVRSLPDLVRLFSVADRRYFSTRVVG